MVFKKLMEKGAVNLKMSKNRYMGGHKGREEKSDVFIV